MNLAGLDVSRGSCLGNVLLLLNTCYDQLAEPFQLLLIESLAIFPHVCKLGHVVPLPKPGNRSNIKNYRLITITSALGNFRGRSACQAEAFHRIDHSSKSK